MLDKLTDLKFWQSNEYSNKKVTMYTLVNIFRARKVNWSIIIKNISMVRWLEIQNSWSEDMSDKESDHSYKSNWLRNKHILAEKLEINETILFRQLKVFANRLMMVGSPKVLNFKVFNKGLFFMVSQSVNQVLGTLQFLERT